MLDDLTELKKQTRMGCSYGPKLKHLGLEIVMTDKKTSQVLVLP